MNLQEELAIEAVRSMILLFLDHYFNSFPESFPSRKIGLQPDFTNIENVINMDS